VVSAFAIYGAHRAFGMKAVVPVVILIVGAVFALLVFMTEVY
jgi:hypothetical protein